jgi:K+-sensing histidine kinase KdpD
VASYISEVTASKKGDDSVSIFPTRILVATDGSREAALAVTTAADLAKSTDSELHVVHVGELPLVYHPERRVRRA